MRLFSVLFAFLALGCASTGTEEIEGQSQALTASELSMLGFEGTGQWTAPVGPVTLTKSPLHSQGSYSLGLSNFGYVQVRNAVGLKRDTSPVPKEVSFDVRIPENTPNKWWRGAVELYIDAPSVGIWGQYLGYRSLDGLPREQFTKLSFPIPNEFRTKLAGNYTDLKFTIAVNVPQGSSTHYLDRFVIGSEVTPPNCVPVDDGNVCTVDECDATTNLPVHRPVAPGTLCSDANACNGAESCNATGVCTSGTPPILDDGNPCTTDSCAASGGVTHVPVSVGTSCSDGNACNGAEVCLANGTCVAGNPPSVDDGNPCTTDACTVSGGVTHTPASAGTSCSDSNSCNGAEVCSATGTCSPGTPLAVDDGNPCTVDACDASVGVTHSPLPSGSLCSDSNACNGVETCNASAVCVAGTVPTTDDGNPCTTDSCDSSLGVVHVAVSAGTSCGDGNACNGAETCNGSGSCVPGVAPTTDDGNPCTADDCSASAGVTHVPVSAGTSCGDGNACNGVETCNGSGSCVAGTVPTTDDGNPCTADSCDASGGVVHAPVSAGTSCGDGNACNGAETCNGSGSCVAGVAPIVDDGNPCTADSCSASGGVTHVAVSAGTSCGDGNACNGAETCNGSGICVAGFAPVVDDGNVCTSDSCDPSSGVNHVALSAGTSCGDGNACNGSETCNGSGSCVAGTAPVIDDGNVCTSDSCDPISGVSHVAASAGTSCGDGNACNGAETCDGSGSCVAGAAPVVDDGNVCTSDSCDPSSGVSHVALSAGTSCGDGDACNGAETCNGSGSCLVGVEPEVDDGNPCTLDSCDVSSGVVHAPAAVGTTCGVGDLCTGNGACNALGACVFVAPEIDDGNPCTIDSCDVATGIRHEVASAGTSCSDGNACNGLEVCSVTGVCVQGTALILDDHNPCTVDSCDAVLGVRNELLPAGSSCSLGTCEGSGACSTEGTCERTAVPIVDENPCTLQFCDETSGAVEAVLCSEVSLASLSTPGGSTRFLVDGPDPVQTGVADGVIDEVKATVVRGRVVWADGFGIPNVAISVLGHPELGQTRSQIDGNFVMLVQGAGELVLAFEKAGYPGASRVVATKPRTDTVVDDIVLVRRDHRASRIQMNAATGQLATASTQFDDAGERTARVYFPPGTSAALRLPGGGLSETSELSVRLTEYTVGEQGSARMPATLPPTSAYTYALELTADEAIAAHAENIEFNQRVFLYTDNFLEFAVGTVIPLGFVDDVSGRWVGVDNGAVLRVVSEEGDTAIVTGHEGLPLDQRPTTDELRRIAEVFEPGDTFWRAGMHHFSKWDANLGYGPPEDADNPPPPPPDPDDDDDDDDDPECGGSRINPIARTVGEDLPLVGTSETMHSTTADCVEPKPLRIPVFGSTVPGPVNFATVDVKIAGREFHYQLGPAPNQTLEFRWDGRDGFGRQIWGSRIAEVDVAYDYPANYEQPYRFGYSGGSLAVGLSGAPSVPGRATIQTHSRWSATMRSLDSEAIGAGGFRLSGHHFYDFEEGVLKLGTGENIRLDDAGIAANVMIGGGTKWPPVVGDRASDLRISRFTLWDASESPGTFSVDFAGEIHFTATDNLDPLYYVHADANGVILRVLRLSLIEYRYLQGFVRAPSGKLFAYHDVWTGANPGGRISEILANGTVQEVHRIRGRYLHKLIPSSDGQGLYFLDADSRNWGAGDRLGFIDVAQTRCRNLFTTEADIQNCYDSRITTVIGSTNTTYAPYPSNPCTTPSLRTAYRWGMVDAERSHDGGILLMMSLPAKPGLVQCKLSLNGDLSQVGVYPLPNPQVGPYPFAAADATTPFGVGLMVDRAEPGLFRLTSPPQRVALRAKKGSEPYVASGPLLPKELNLLTYDFNSMFSAENLKEVWVAPSGREFLISDWNHVWSIRSPLPRYGDKTVVPSQDGSEFYTFLVDGRHSETRSRATGAVTRRFEYDASTKRLTAALRLDAAGNVSERISFARDSAGRLSEIAVDPDGNGSASSFRHSVRAEADGYLTELKNPANEVFSLDYDGPRRGLVTRFEYPSGRASRYTYEPSGRLLSQTDVPLEGAEGTFSYLPTGSAMGSSVTRTTPSGFSAVFGKVDGEADKDSSAYSYADGTSLSKGMDADSVSRSTERDGTSTVTTMTPDPESFGQSKYSSTRTTTLPESGLTASSKLTKTVTNNPDGSIASKTVTSCQASEGQNLCSTESYASSTRTTTVTSAEGRVATSVADALSRVVEARSAGSPRLRTVYSGDNVSAVIVDPDGVVGNADDRKTTMVYDASTGNLAKIIDPLTHETLFVNYDAAARPGAIVLPDSSAVGMTYDTEGNVASVTPPGKAAHGMSYGMNGRIESYSPPVGNPVGFHYDLDRRMDFIDFGSGSVVDFGYDSVTGQLSAATSPSGTISVGYSNGHMTSLVSPTALGPITTNIDYDGMLPTSVGWSGPIVGNVNWTYNDRFLVASETIGAQANTSVSYAYDKDGLVTSAGALTIGRDATSGRVTTKTVGNIRETFTYSKYGELAAQKVERLSGGSVVETLYEAVYEDGGVNGARDAMGRIVKKTERIVSGDTPTSGARPLDTKVYDYGYNQAGRPWLESVAVNGTVINSYSYDANGNRIAAELHPSLLGADPANDVSLDQTETEYDSGDRLLRYGTKTYSWNDFGQLSSMTDTATDETTSYHYDLFGNLLRVDLPDGRAVEYDVDGAGRRVGRRVLDENSVELEYRGWIYRDLLRPIAEVDTMGNVVARYVYADGTGAEQNGVTQLLVRLGANPDTSLPFSGRNVPEYVIRYSNGVASDVLRLVTNHLGTVHLATNVATGQVVQRLDYDEFGRVFADSNPGTQPFGFAGGLTDSLTELVRFGARDYSPEVGRWMARDPVRFESTYSLYGYLEGTPTNDQDWLGLGPVGTACSIAVTISCRQSCKEHARGPLAPVQAVICSTICSSIGKFAFCDPADPSPPPPPQPSPPQTPCDPSTECCGEEG